MEKRNVEKEDIKDQGEDVDGIEMEFDKEGTSVSYTHLTLPTICSV